MMDKVRKSINSEGRRMVRRISKAAPELRFVICHVFSHPISTETHTGTRLAL
jgi:hypothetical protein